MRKTPLKYARRRAESLWTENRRSGHVMCYRSRTTYTKGRCWLTHRGIPESRGSWLKAAWRVGDAVWGEIARGLFGCRASGVGPAVEERKPEPTAVVAVGDRRRDGSLRSGQDRRNGPPDAARLGPSLQRVGSGGPRRQLDGGAQASSFGGATGSVRADRRGRSGS